MDEDRIAGFFNDLHDYPGKRRPVMRDVQIKRGGPQELVAWDDHPRMLRFQGELTEFFTIRNVALALNRSARTIRHWEAEEIIPPPTFRSAKPSSSALKHVGDRLWTRAQVEAMVRIAGEERVLDGLPPGPGFTAKLVRAFLALQEHPNRNTT